MTCVQKIKRSVTLFAQFITTSFGLREFFGFCEIRFSEQTTIFGLINPELVSGEWLRPIGRTLVVSKEITGIQAPATLDEFTDLVVALKDKVSLKQTPVLPFDLKPFAIRAKRSVFRPWFAEDYRKFKPVPAADAKEILLPGNLTTVDFTALPGESLMMLETEFHLTSDRTIRLLVNPPANMLVWVDGEFRFGRECGVMVPAFHRAAVFCGSRLFIFPAVPFAEFARSASRRPADEPRKRLRVAKSAFLRNFCNRIVRSAKKRIRARKLPVQYFPSRGQLEIAVENLRQLGAGDQQFFAEVIDPELRVRELLLNESQCALHLPLH